MDSGAFLAVMWKQSRFKVVYKEKTGSREAYLSRDRHLVDNSAYCIAYCTRNYGGTAYSVRYAMKSGVAVLNTADYDITYL